ncbi:MAG: glycoside hydrolase family 15 protein [Actinomycetota bacterium]
MTDTPIADYAILSDCHSAALVSRGGSIDWLCLPRFDRPSVFGRLVGTHAGHWAIAPLGDAEVSRRYAAETLVLETTFRTPTGTARLSDAMALTPSDGGHDLGAAAPRVLVRRVDGIDGEVRLRMEFAPRPEYGLVRPLLTPVDGGVLARGGAEVLALSAPGECQLNGSTATFEVVVPAGSSASFALHRRGSEEAPPRTWSQEEIAGLLDATTRAWREWSSAHQNYEGPWRDLVYHSGRVLQGLTYRPTGAIVAAPTTSLPETVGGERNWDYRYSWVRDASFTLDALWVAACPDEAHAYFAWLAGAAASGMSDGAHLQIMFGIGGEHDLTERVVEHLDGWRGSRPVRIGNGAWSQRQLDVYGELLDATARLHERLGDPAKDTGRFLVAAADAAAERWEERDQGIWEVRSEPRDFLYSKLMCWVALDRAIALAPAIGGEGQVEAWTATRAEIREAILTRGWSETAGAFTQAFGGEELDASGLMIPIVGFLPGDDPRVRSTIDAIEERLTDERGLVYRYLVGETDDGVRGEEGTFLLCTFWLAQALAIAGETARARAVFERAIAYANDVGLLSEEVDDETGELLGNFPQAFSHIGLVNAAWAIAQAEAGGVVAPQPGEASGGRPG